MNVFNQKSSKNVFFSLKQIKDLQHDHSVRFIGAVVDYPHFYLVTEYFSRGSLQVKKKRVIIIFGVLYL